MLKAWGTDEDLWPRDRTQEMFEEWFEVETFSIVEDIYLDDAIE